MINKEGYGVFKWASGNIYQGMFKDDERHAKGKMTWTDGSWYDGEWFRGIQHGYGLITFPDGSEKEGYFDNNVFIGKMKEDDGNYATLDAVKIYPKTYNKIDKTKSVKKLKYEKLQPNVREKIDSFIVNRNRPKPLIKSKYMKSGGQANKLPTLRSSLPKLKSPLTTSKNAKTLYKSSRKWHTNRSGSKNRTIIR